MWDEGDWKIGKLEDYRLQMKSFSGPSLGLAGKQDLCRYGIRKAMTSLWFSFSLANLLKRDVIAKS